MHWLRKQIREGMNARTYVLVGALLGLLLWIHSLDERTRGLRARSAGSGGASAPAPAAPPVGSGSERVAPAMTTPPGWGDDPFDRRFG